MTEQELHTYHEHAFDAFCKKIIKHAAADAYRAKSRQSRMEVDVGDSLERYISRLQSDDNYIFYSRTYHVKSIPITVKDRMLGEALQYIVPNKRAVLLLSFFGGYNDIDISRLLGISLTSVARRKSSALIRLRALLEVMNGQT